MPRVLVTNDDGVRSEGLHALAGALAPLGEVYVVAPTGEASAVGHALTVRRPLRIDKISERWFGVDGTPTDCINIAISQILEGVPDLIASGINKGWNLGDDVTYSGTVAGAMEGALLGVPSLAVSQQRVSGSFDFTQAASAAVCLTKAMLDYGWPARTFLNVNVPRRKARGIRVTAQAHQTHGTAVVDGLDPRQRPYCWIEEGPKDWEPNSRSDYEAVRDGWISVAPLQPDWTDYNAMDRLEALALGAYSEAR